MRCLDEAFKHFEDRNAKTKAVSLNHLQKLFNDLAPAIEKMSADLCAQQEHIKHLELCCRGLAVGAIETYSRFYRAIGMYEFVGLKSNDEL